MHNICSDNFADIYSKVLDILLYNCDYKVNPRGLSISECLNFNIELTNPYNNLFTNENRSIPLKYLCGELIWYFSGKNDLDFISRYSQFWNNICNTDKTLNSAYGYLIFTEKNKYGFTQWEWAKKSLIDDVDSRQAIIHFNNSSHQYDNVRDFVCTLYGQFFIRENKLFFKTFMRSQDIYFGMTFDIPFFTLLMQCMHRELIKYYPNLVLGTYEHHVGSLHVYENKIDICKKMVSSMIQQNKSPLIIENPIGNYDILSMYNGIKYNGNDSFFKWLSINALEE